MKIPVLPYYLPDASLFSGAGDNMMIWQPEETIVVLGQSNTPEKSLIVENVAADNIHVTKRPTGGEAVVLTPRMAVISVARSFIELPSPKNFFSEVNSTVMEALSSLGIRDLEARGISDIAIGNRKILGSSMHRHENRLVYHAVLNIGEDPQTFERYLCHPVREPDYRLSRSHREFVTSLKGEGYTVSLEDLKEMIFAVSAVF